MIFNAVWDDYTDWLYEEFGTHLKTFRGRTWHEIFILLNNQDYVWFNKMDENRSLDGKEIRQLYFNQSSDWGDYVSIDFGNRCSILEMLIGLAMRIDKEYVGSPDDQKVIDILEFFFKNLDIYPGQRTLDTQYMINCWMLNEYHPKGPVDIFIVPKDVDYDEWQNLEVWRKMTKNLRILDKL